jgi:cytochrome c biogenesis protein CcdA
VNLVEAVCSAGLPAVYTQILSLNDLNKTEYYLYVLLYIFFFMVDDLIIFFVAMKTLHMTGASKKYSRFSKLVGGFLMVVIGILLIFKPELLMFG